MNRADLSRLIAIVVDEVLAAQRPGGGPLQCGCHAVLYECCPDRLHGVLDAGATRLGLHATGGRPGDVAALIDHTLLKPDASRADIEKLCREASEFGFATVCINPSWVALGADRLRGTSVAVCTVVGFPLGATTPDVKHYETRRTIFDGAREVDMVINVGALKSGEWLLVQGGSSGVGTAAIQIAKHLGAKGIAVTGSEEKARRLRKLGADVTIDISQGDFLPEVMRVTDNRGVDVVLEMIGGEVYQKSLQALAPGGRLVSIGGAFGSIPDSPPDLTEGRKATRFSITNDLKANPDHFKQIDEILRLVQQKKLHVVVDKSFPLAETRAAQRYLEGREHFGKVMLIV